MKLDGRVGKLIGLLVAGFLAACVGGAQSNKVALSGGIGGTGITPWEGGIGGTGVVGTITGFGSIIVNGLHIEYRADQTVESATGPMTGANFAVGQVVAAQTRHVNGRLVADRLIAQTAVVGTVESVNLATREVRVLGETVHVMANAETNMNGLNNVRVGDTVAVSGHRGADGVYASRVDSMAADARPSISGTVTAMTNTTVTLDQVREVVVSSNAGIAIGDYASAMGVSPAADGRVVARAVTKAYGLMFNGGVTRMSVEGIFAPGAVSVPGAGQATGLPTGRAVVFVSKQANGSLAVDGAGQRPADDWRQNLSISQSQSQTDPQSGPSTNGGGSGGGGSGGGGGGSGGGGSGGGNGGGR